MRGGSVGRRDFANRRQSLVTRKLQGATAVGRCLPFRPPSRGGTKAASVNGSTCLFATDKFRGWVALPANDVETRIARNTGNSSAHNAFNDTAFNILEQQLGIAANLRKEFSGVAVAQMLNLLAQRPDDGLKAATLRKLKDRSDELQYSVTAKNIVLSNSFDQQNRKIWPRLANLENKETALAEQIRADAEAEQDRRRTEIGKAVADADNIATQKAAEQQTLKRPGVG